MRRVARVDANQAEIVEALRRAGATVTLLHTLGSGCPDLLCGFRGHNYLLECKAKGGVLTGDEREWLALWRGQSAIVFSAEDALEVIGVEAKQ